MKPEYAGMRPWAARRPTRGLRVGHVNVGGDAPISVQSMTKTDTRDVAATVAQLLAMAEAGCDIARLAIPDAEAAAALPGIRRAVDMPLVADIHFDYRLALAALDAGVDGLRINPGNIGDAERVRAIVRAAGRRGTPIRIGVNAGSLEADLRERFGGPTPEALVESALRQARALEAEGFDAVKLSVKASDVPRTVAAYRLLSERTDCPLHLGVTEAGTLLPGTVRSTAAIAILLSEGIGDTIRVSLADAPEREIAVGLAVLDALELRSSTPRVVACPTCGRTQVDVRRIAAEVETALCDWARRQPDGKPMPVVAVMGCAVNGPGEAREADIALVGGKDRFRLYVGGEPTGSVAPETAVAELLDAVSRWTGDRPDK